METIWKENVKKVKIIEGNQGNSLEAKLNEITKEIKAIWTAKLHQRKKEKRMCLSQTNDG